MKLKEFLANLTRPQIDSHNIFVNEVIIKKSFGTREALIQIDD